MCSSDLLRKQREMIEGLIQRVSEHAAKTPLSDSGIIPPRDPSESDEWMRTTKFNVADLAAATTAAQEMHAAKQAAPAPAPAPPPRPAPASPLISDDFMSQIGGLTPGAAPAAPATPAPVTASAPAFNPEATQQLPTEMAQRLPAGAMDTQRLPAGANSTQKLPADPTVTQKLAGDTQKMPVSPDRTKTIKLPDQ